MDSFEGIFEFVAVAESGGFSSAAKVLNCSTSHISRQVARLEQRVGCSLFARTTRQINLTENGTFYYQQSKQLITGLQQANEQLAQQQFNLSGTLRVSAAGGFAENYIAPALMEFAKLHPELSIDIDFNSRMVNFVEDGIDFAIRYGELNDSNLIARKLVSRSMMAVASPAYLKEYGTPTHPLQLKQHNCVIANNDNWVFQIDGTKHTIKVKGNWRSNNANVVVSACVAGLGIAYMPQRTFDSALSEHTLTPVLAPFWSSGATSWIVYQNRQFQPLRTRLAIEFLLKYFEHY
ncbi:MULTISPECIES: LysR family transcriptional regulator [Pseudoalteromonas]|uniref:Transcriptional regulator n=1 Tax=Pseudoalteromonas luteoviolacea (strain 2ta16) TaxID=1353533 RepID=V4HIM7_PSEL2|nr:MULTISPECIES: LysR family transcriptional regulator [Pseudoalteromonas]ESP90660.1 transcriptional regulator [Pseudoalteromonas luteoviolacea 2ta16]KZN41764.1 LysR family transcriptional regulator [Pseudoalteromonas luteoviolacea NCIMB 1944]MCG7548077.1 LysR family transcriptional regulator [Pseudoalteromonas sp. Of7M-16]